mgnify:CR=1 FL=1
MFSLYEVVKMKHIKSKFGCLAALVLAGCANAELAETIGPIYFSESTIKPEWEEEIDYFRVPGMPGYISFAANPPNTKLLPEGAIEPSWKEGVDYFYIPGMPGYISFAANHSPNRKYLPESAIRPEWKERVDYFRSPARRGYVYVITNSPNEK